MRQVFYKSEKFSAFVYLSSVFANFESYCLSPIPFLHWHRPYDRIQFYKQGDKRSRLSLGIKMILI